MPKSLNLLFKIVYFILIVIPVFYLLAGTYSYFFVLNTFGHLPYDDYSLYKEAQERNLPINIFPIRYGDLLLSATLYVYLISPFFILLNYLRHKKSQTVVFYKKYAFALIITCLSSFCFHQIGPLQGWYTQLIFD